MKLPSFPDEREIFPRAGKRRKFCTTILYTFFVFVTRRLAAGSREYRGLSMWVKASDKSKLYKKKGRPYLEQDPENTTLYSTKYI